MSVCSNAEATPANRWRIATPVENGTDIGVYDGTGTLCSTLSPAPSTAGTMFGTRTGGMAMTCAWLEGSDKLIVVEKHVGKTSIIIQYIENTFSNEYVMSTSADKSIKEIELENGTKIRIEIWDTAGQEIYRATNKIFMKNTKIALLVYDITDQKSFDALNEFYEQINEINGKENVFFAV